MPFYFRWRISCFGAASKALSCVCASLSLPCLARRPAVMMGRACRSIKSFIAHLLVVPWFECGSLGSLLVPVSFDSLATGILSFFVDSFEVVVQWFSYSHCWSLLHWSHLSVFRPASAVDYYLSSLRAGNCGLQLRRRVPTRVLMVACLPLLRVWQTAPSRVPLMTCASTRIVSSQFWALLVFPLCGFLAGLCRSSLASPSQCLSKSAPPLHRPISPHCGFV